MFCTRTTICVFDALVVVNWGKFLVNPVQKVCNELISTCM